MSDINNQVMLTLGDWSEDGHSKSNKVLVLTNCKVLEMQEAYKASCRLTGVSFNHNEDFTGELNRKVKHHVCTEYEDNTLSEEVIAIFKEHNCPWEQVGISFNLEGELDEESYEGISLDEDIFLKLLLWFISLSKPDFKWQIPTREDIPVFNGWWDENLNVQLGYGLYR